MTYKPKTYQMPDFAEALTQYKYDHSQHLSAVKEMEDLQKRLNDAITKEAQAAEKLKMSHKAMIEIMKEVVANEK